jgi:hypothetical protein
MKQKIFGYVAMEIDRLTKDDDTRQDLWIFFLEGNSPFLFKKYLDKIKNNKELEDGYGIKKRL